jgi:hypothetical protein
MLFRRRQGPFKIAVGESLGLGNLKDKFEKVSPRFAVIDSHDLDLIPTRQQTANIPLSEERRPNLAKHNTDGHDWDG